MPFRFLFPDKLRVHSTCETRHYKISKQSTIPTAAQSRERRFTCELNQVRISLIRFVDFNEHGHCTVARGKESLPAGCLKHLALSKSAVHGRHTRTLERPSSLRPAQRGSERIGLAQESRKVSRLISSETSPVSFVARPRSC